MAKVHTRKRKASDHMDEFVQSMSIILTRMLAQAERIEACLDKQQYDMVRVEAQELKKQTDQLITAFEMETRSS